MSGYMITDGNGCYIRHDAQSNRYVPVRGERYGGMWDKKKADNICGALPRRLKQFYFVVQSSQDEEPLPLPAQQDDVLVSYADPAQPDNDALLVWQRRISDVIRFAEDVVRRSEELNLLLSKMDSELTDLDHYLEFNFRRLNAYQGWMLTKMRYDVLLKRRTIKDEMSVIKDVRGCLPSGDVLDRAVTTVSRIDDRSYKPRVLKQLFEEGIK